MSFNRRTFLGAAAVNAAALSLPSDLFAGVPSQPAFDASSEEWDLSWRSRLNGKYKAVFDNAEVESGYGVWRAAAWARQYRDVVKAAPAEITPAIVLRHNAIVLAMQNSFWEKYKIGASKGVTHPLTGKPTKANPVLLDEKDGIPEPFNNASLRKQLDRGVVVLACDLALQDCIELIKRTDRIGDAEARKQAIAAMIPGVILQPSGVFAVTLAQEAGASYVKAS